MAPRASWNDYRAVAAKMDGIGAVSDRIPAVQAVQHGPFAAVVEPAP